MDVCNNKEFRLLYFVICLVVDVVVVMECKMLLLLKLTNLDVP